MTILHRTRKLLTAGLLAVLLVLSVVLLLGRMPVGVRYGSPSSGLPDAATNGMDIVSAARKQIGVTVVYDPAYRKIPYPNGDVPMDRGVCSDVIVRALRDARGMDLQKLVHEDMASHFRFPVGEATLMSLPDLKRRERRFPDGEPSHAILGSDAVE